MNVSLEGRGLRSPSAFLVVIVFFNMWYDFQLRIWHTLHSTRSSSIHQISSLQPPSMPGSSTLGYFRWINVSLLSFKHTRSWIFSSCLEQWLVRTSLRGHPRGHRGANHALGQGSLVIIMQGIFSLPSAEARQHDTGHRLLYSFLTAFCSLQLQVCCI